jgi:tRNA/tmRNA/rRNA uracil-C5-methylase (TrmA/RlmC/RlmD family)
VFTQINAAMVGRLVSSVRELLRLRSDEHLFDLYCGYGLFSLSLAGGVRRVTGAEISRDAIDAAVANAHRQNVTNVRFMRMDVTASAVGSLLTDARHGDVVVLDPPRGGTSPGVIEAIAARRPRRVVHIVCAIDLVAPELERWITSGYRCSRAVPLDLFPGTSSLETLLCLEPIEPGA